MAELLNFLLGESSSSSEEEIDPRDLTADEEIMTDAPERLFVTFAEIFFLYHYVGEAGGAVRMKRMLGGAELAVAMIQCGCSGSELFTVLPSTGGHLEYIKNVMKANGVGLKSLPGRSNTVGDVTVMSDGSRIFQRETSAFASMSNRPFQWEKGIIADRVPCWVHLTYSSVAFSDTVKETWIHLMEVATSAENVYTSVELDMINVPEDKIGRVYQFILPYLTRIELVILSVNELWAMAKLNKITVSPDESISNLVKQLRSFFECNCLAVVVPPTTLVASHKSDQSIERTFPEIYSERKIVASLIQALTHEPHFTDSEQFSDLIFNKLSGNTTPNIGELTQMDSMDIYRIE